MKITILINNKNSWINHYIQSLCSELEKQHCVRIVFDHAKLRKGDLCFLLGCTKIVPADYLKFHKHNLVIHESDLPNGAGFSPLSWQVLEGKSVVPVVLFEADAEVDAGVIYEKTFIHLDNTELLDEIREKQWLATTELIFRFLKKYPNLNKSKITGKQSFYPRRTRKDDEIPIQKTIEELFDRFRVADNERWPLYFNIRGETYYLKIYKKLS